jgi:hypothetical protein
MIWTTKDGSKVEISQMTTTHLKNAIKYLEDKYFLGFSRDEDLIIPNDKIVTIKLIPSESIVSQYEEMKKVLCNRKLDEKNKKIIEDYKKSTINILEFL